MKTSNNLKMRNRISIFSFMIVALLMLDSCQKAELVQPAADKSADKGTSVNARQGVPVILPGPVPSFVFDMIKIDHVSSRSSLPDYSVTVNSNGTVLYEGRRNVHVTGFVRFRISSVTLKSINEVCKAIDFYTIKDDLSEYADLPYVSTSYLGNSFPRVKTLIDYGNGYPVNLVAFRTKIEGTLNINKFIGTIGGTVGEWSDEK